MKPHEIGQGSFDKRLKEFYNTKEWKELREEILQTQENICVVCGQVHHLRVDHIKPVRTHWELRLSKDNLQILCDECNREKGSKNYWTFEEHKKFKKVGEIERAIKKLYEKKKSILSSLPSEWSNTKVAEPRKKPEKPKLEVLKEGTSKTFRIRKDTTPTVRKFKDEFEQIENGYEGKVNLWSFLDD